MFDTSKYVLAHDMRNYVSAYDQCWIESWALEAAAQGP